MIKRFLVDKTQQRLLELCPYRGHYASMRQLWVPYLELVEQPNYRSPVINTDDFGVRYSHSPDGEMIGLENIAGRSCNVVIGGSTVLGDAGVSSDTNTLTSHLARKTGTRWLNLGTRGAHIMQGLVRLLLHRSELSRVEHIVVFAGGNEWTTMSGLTTTKSGSFFRIEHLFRQINDWMCDSNKNGVAIKGGRKALGGLYQATSDLVLSKALAQESLTNALRGICDIARIMGARISFVLQPVTLWTSRQESTEELELNELLRKRGGAFVRAERAAPDVYSWLAPMCETISNDLGIPFLDSVKFLSQFPHDNEWLFVDHVHLTDLGCEIFADWLANEVK